MSGDGGSSGSFEMVMVEDSPDARLFIELSSYAADLVEAAEALDLAVRGEEPNSPLAEAQYFLVGFAVVAYCRTIMPSKVRGLLTDHVSLPAELVGTHEMVRMFRNRTIAHSQSDLAVTYPIGVLDSGSLEVRDVMAPTIVTPLPRTEVSKFQRLVATMQEQVDEVLAPIRARLADQLRSASKDDLLGRSRPAVEEALAEHFDARTTRSPYPTSHTLYWVRDDPKDPPADV